MPSFLALPLELRLEIYRYSLTPSPRTLPGDPEQLLTSTTHDFPVSILLLNKQIHTEAKEIFYRENTFNIAVDYTLPCIQRPRIAELRAQLLPPELQPQPQSAPQPSVRQMLPIHSYITHVNLSIVLKMPLVYLYHHYDLSSPNDYFLRRVIANMASICSVLSLAPTIKTITLVFPESKRSGERESARWRVRRTERMGGRENRRVGLTLGFLVGRVGTPLLREAVGRVLGGLGVLAERVAVEVWWEEGQEGRDLDGLRGVVEGVLEERRMRCCAGERGEGV